MGYNDITPKGWAGSTDSPAPIRTGRSILAGWLEAQPDNYFTADRNLQRILEFYWGTALYKEHIGRLYRFGNVCATTLDDAARLSNLTENLPRLDLYDGIGRYTGQVAFHPSYHDAGRAIYGSEVMSVLGKPGNNLLSLALFYLSSHNGEAGHNCPLACTAGMIKVLQAAGSPALREQYLPRLLDANYDSNYHGAQFLTEVQGGSDVGANGTMATPLDPVHEGTWLLNGEKWFCSNVTADLALVTARVPGQGEGTKGLGLFLVPRLQPDGTLNNVRIRRLKDKLGTRSMASGELDFVDALAYQVGETGDGFRNMMVHVINTSRIFNAVGCSANAHRAYLVAWSYAQHRRAFEQPIIFFPLVQDVLTKMRSDTTAMLSGTLRIVKTIDDLETGRADDEETAGFLRMAINLNKYRSAVLAHEVINHGIEILGGNGAIESFSVLPRLLRDNVVFENWEGTHNVLMAQVQRDMRRYEVHQPFFNQVRRMLEPLNFKRLRREALAELDTIEEQLAALLAMDELSASLPFRPLMDRLTDIYYLACMGVEAAWELYQKEDRTKQRLAEFFLDRRVMRREPIDISNYGDQVSRLCHALRPDRLPAEEEDEE
jgi:alkylation response protein AidB-like acyl-CoA dehydrogenase